MTPDQVHAHITPIILKRLDSDQGRRGEALRDFLALNLPGLDEAATASIASLAPRLPESLYRKWIGLFIDRMLATVEPAQIKDLCSGGEKNAAALGMLYMLFMESERMEKQVPADLANLAEFRKTDGRMGDAVMQEALAAYLRAKLQRRKGNANE
ncbi:MAG: hypothetical protein LBM64_07545 [Deltaproteobacteria bacterium]|jgi:hypothetical protein|nr:hypothetical protein [Deltaproteobacteria bacterium]